LTLGLPDGDDDFPTRIAAIKAQFTHSWLAAGGAEQPRTGSRVASRRSGVWQRHFWEHLIRDQDDFNAHLDYLHYNPVKHGLAKCPHQWPYTSFHKWVASDGYEPNWQCTCDRQTPLPPKFHGIDERLLEMAE
jgi:putative transposase